MKRFLLIAAAFTILGILPSQAVNIADLENARGYAYLYRMNGQNYYAEQRVKVIAGEGNNFEIIGRTYSHQGAQYYMTEYINHYYFDQDNDTIQWVQDQRNIIDARINSRGQDYYWLAGELDYGAESVPTDVEYARKGYITGVALTWKQQCDSDMEAVKNILEKI